MATKLKKMKLTSVDLTRAGANQKADICLYKSAAMVDEEQQERKVGKSMIKIDKSRFDADELEMYNALIEKAKVEIEEDEEEFEEPAFVPPSKKKVELSTDNFDDEYDDEEYFEEPARPTRKSDPVLMEALERMEQLEKSLAMKEFTEIAKTYEPLGENAEDLAKTMYDMYQDSPENYQAYLKVLNKSLQMVEKSGVFAEIGKSAGAYGSQSSTVKRVESIAKSYIENDPELSYEQALAKAWEKNPDLIREYENEYRK